MVIRAFVLSGIVAAVVLLLSGCKYIAPMTAVTGPSVEIQQQETPSQSEAVESTTIEITWPAGVIEQWND